MKLPELAVSRPVLTTVVFLVVALFGVVAWYLIPIDLYPDIEMPVITVVTTYKGASAEDIEERITKPIEESLGIIKNLDELTASSKEGVSAVALKFDFGTDLSEAASDIRQYLDFARRRLPEDVDPPMIFQLDFSQLPILTFGVVSDVGDVKQERDFVEDNVLEAIRRIPGVGTVVFFGAPAFEVAVELNRDRLERHGITQEQVVQAIASENYTEPAGTLDEGVMELTVRMPAEFGSFDEMEDMIVAGRGDSVVRLSDVGRVKRDLEEMRTVTRLDGKLAMMCGVMKQSGANTVRVAEAVQAELNRLGKVLPSHLHIIPVVDNSVFIRNMMENLTNTLLVSVALVVLVVLVFLRRWRPSLIVGVALPASTILAFFGLYLFDFTMNMISMMAVTLGIGMVVDNAIVVLENVTRHIDEFGANRTAAAVEGTRQVGGAITASTLTTLAVFGPLVFVSGFIAVLFNQLALVVTMTIGASLFVALTLTPMMCSRLLKPGRMGTRGDKLFDLVDTGYSRVIRWALDHRVLVVLGAMAIAGSTAFVVRQIGTDFMPEPDSGDLSVSIELPIGSGLSQTRRIAEEVSDLLMEQPEVAHVMYRAGSAGQGFGAAMGARQGSHVIAMSLRLKPLAERTRSDAQVADVIRGQLRTLHGVERADIRMGNVASRLMSGGARPVTFEVRGDDLNAMTEVELQIKEILLSTEGTKDVTADIPQMIPEVRYVIDRKAAARLQVSVAAAGQALRTALTGMIAGKYRGGSDDLDIYVRMEEPDRKDVAALERVQVRSRTGKLVQLGDIGRFDDYETPLEIQRKDKQRVIAVGANKTSRPIGDIAAEIESRMREAGLFDRHDVSLVAAGDIKQTQDTNRALIIALVLGIILVYLVMAAQFESFLDPFVILFSIPFAFTGAFLALYWTGTSLSVPAFLGLIVLVGVVVNNAIVLVDYVNLLRREQGMARREALELTARRRLRPILMTTLTTVFGLLPMALGTGEGGTFWRPLGLASLGGLSLSTLVTLVLVPVVYDLFEFARGR